MKLKSKAKGNARFGQEAAGEDALDYNNTGGGGGGDGDGNAKDIAKVKVVAQDIDTVMYRARKPKIGRHVVKQKFQPEMIKMEEEMEEEFRLKYLFH